VAKFFSRTRTKIIIIEHSLFSRTAINTSKLIRRLIAGFIFPYLMRTLYPHAKAIVCVSKGVANDIARITGCQNKIRVIYNPIVDVEMYTLAREPVSHPWFFDKDIPIILAVGRLVKAKDYPTLFRAFSLVLQRKPARLLVLGEGKERKKLEKLAQELAISDKIALLGLQKNPYKFMANASIFVLSSQQEGFSTAIVEAMACGLPVVSTDCEAGPGEIIENGKNGFLVSVGDSKAFAEAMIKLLENPSLRQDFSREGKKRAQDFTVENKSREYEQLFLEIVKNHI
jgi:glycosyltransferase involved in cell wall biosynthesis